MVKNWADHCSLDEEDINEEEEEEERALAPPEVPQQQQEPPAAAAAAKKQQPCSYDFPSEPPYTAHVGNLAFAVDQSESLADEITGLAQQLLGLQVNVMDARIAPDHHHRGGGRDPNRGDDHHNNNKPWHHRFGYVQVETLEQLQGLMQLNEKEGVLVAGRRIQLDTANAPRQ